VHGVPAEYCKKEAPRVRGHQRVQCWIVAPLRAGGVQDAGRSTRAHWPAEVKSKEAHAVGQLPCQTTVLVHPLSGCAGPARDPQARATFLRAGSRCEGLGHAEIPMAAALLSLRIMLRHEMGRLSLPRGMSHQKQTMSSKTLAHRSKPEPLTAS
jgi:hypothetical protein